MDEDARIDDDDVRILLQTVVPPASVPADDDDAALRPVSRPTLRPRARPGPRARPALALLSPAALPPRFLPQAPARPRPPSASHRLTVGVGILGPCPPSSITGLCLIS